MTNIFYTQPNLGDLNKQDNWTLNEDGPKVYAKQINLGNSTKYMIRVDSSHKLINPFSYDQTTEFNGHRNFVDKTCKKDSENRYTKVNAKCFEYYLSFLRTKNIAWLTNAQRETD